MHIIFTISYCSQETRAKNFQFSILSQRASFIRDAQSLYLSKYSWYLYKNILYLLEISTKENLRNQSLVFLFSLFYSINKRCLNLKRFYFAVFALNLSIFCTRFTDKVYREKLYVSHFLSLFLRFTIWILLYMGRRVIQIKRKYLWMCVVYAAIIQVDFALVSSCTSKTIFSSSTSSSFILTTDEAHGNDAKCV